SREPLTDTSLSLQYLPDSGRDLRHRLLVNRTWQQIKPPPIEHRELFGGEEQTGNGLQLSAEVLKLRARDDRPQQQLNLVLIDFGMTNRVANYRDHCVPSGAFRGRVEIAITAARPVSARFQAIALRVHLVKARPESEPATQRSLERGQRRERRWIVRVARAVSVDGIAQACGDGRLAFEKFCSRR